MPKNIEMSVLNSEGSYDVLYPATMSNITYLTDAVSTLFDLAEGSSLDEALIRLLVGTDGYGYIVTLKYHDGTPASGLTLRGITSIDGGNPVTDSNGWAFGKSNNTSVTIKMTGKNWLDVDFSSFQIRSTGTITNYNHVIPLREDDYILKVSSSQNYDENYLSPWIKTIDICGVGGGGGGGGAYKNSGYIMGAAGGGGGGYVQNSLNIVINSGDILKIQIGSGGKGGIGTYQGDTAGAGRSGGNTVVSLQKSLIGNEEELIRALGGSGAPGASEFSNAINRGGSGNGKGGNGSGYYTNASNGTNGTAYIFNKSSLGLAGGGGGGGSFDEGSVPQNILNKKGGLPYGGDGGVKSLYTEDGRETLVQPKSGSGFGGGGGGGVDYDLRAADGHDGGVYLRFHHT